MEVYGQPMTATYGVAHSMTVVAAPPKPQGLAGRLTELEAMLERVHQHMTGLEQHLELFTRPQPPQTDTALKGAAPAPLSKVECQVENALESLATLLNRLDALQGAIVV